MRSTLAGMLVIAACYTPTVAPNVPCSPTGECPEGQVCQELVCVAPGQIDAGHDAITADDRDGDGIANAADNCPDDRNGAQANEDGDRFGDACDPCPPERNDSPSDPDGDGVADACDPNPTTTGDAIQLFEGFRQGMPAWMPSANWTAAPTGEALRVISTEADDEWVIIPAETTDRVSVTAAIVVEQLGGGLYHEVGIAVPFQASTYSGISCFVADDEGRYFEIWDDFRDDGLGFNGFAWANNVEYRVTMVHRGTSYACDVTEPNNTKHSVSGTTTTTVGTPSIALRAYAITARVSWVMIVRSP